MGMPLSSTTPQSQLPLINPLPSQLPPTLPHPLPMLSPPKSPPNLMPSNTVLLMNTLDLNSVPQKPLTAKLSLDHTPLLFLMVASKLLPTPLTTTTVMLLMSPTQVHPSTLRPNPTSLHPLTRLQLKQKTETPLIVGLDIQFLDLILFGINYFSKT